MGRFNHYREEDDILHNFALRDEMFELAERHGLDGFAVQSFNSIPNELARFFSSASVWLPMRAIRLGRNRICTPP